MEIDDAGPHRSRFAVRVPARILRARWFRRVGPRVIPPAHRFVYRVTGGRTLLSGRAQPLLLLTTRGAKSGLPRQTPLAAVSRADGTVLVVGSNFAREAHPAWTANLLAHPRAEMSLHGVTTPVTARLLTGDERERAWPELVAWYPNWDDYIEITDREFRIFELRPDSERPGGAVRSG